MQETLISSGTYGKVYRVTDGNVTYAEKRQPNDIIFGSFHIKEIAIMRKLRDHPNIAQLFRVDITDTNTNILMEIADFTLNDVIKSQTVTPPEQKRIFMQLLVAVKYCHDNNILHGDIKPLNILVNNGLYKLTDFGLSTLFSCKQTHNAKLYTLAYRAPEIILGGTYDESADIWALGATFYEVARPNKGYGFAEAYPITEESTIKMAFKLFGLPLPLHKFRQLPKWKSEYEIVRRPKWIVKSESFDPTIAELLTAMLAPNPLYRLRINDCISILKEGRVQHPLDTSMTEMPTCLTRLQMQMPNFQQLIRTEEMRQILSDHVYYARLQHIDTDIIELSICIFDKIITDNSRIYLFVSLLIASKLLRDRSDPAISYDDISILTSILPFALKYIEIGIYEDLEYDLIMTTPNSFFRIYAQGLSDQTITYAEEICVNAMIVGAHTVYNPEMIALASLIMASYRNGEQFTYSYSGDLNDIFELLGFTV